MMTRNDEKYQGPQARYRSVPLRQVALKVDGDPLRRMREIVRSAICPEHGVKTSDFQGVNERGWLFRCSRRAEEQPRLLESDEPLPIAKHLFTVPPPADADEKVGSRDG